jgi:hypothetical protein
VGIFICRGNGLINKTDVGKFFKSEQTQKIAKAVGALATIAVATSALFVSIQAKNQQARDAADLRELQSKAYGLQQQLVDSSKSDLKFVRVGIRLEFPEYPPDNSTTARREYPDAFEGAADTVPENEWKAASNKRWAFVQLVNSGGKGIAINDFALRTSYEQTTPLHANPLCFPRLEPNEDEIVKCADFLNPGQSLVVYIGLNDIELAQITEEQRRKGFELCVNTGMDKQTCGLQNNLRLPKYALTGGQDQAGAPR